MDSIRNPRKTGVLWPNGQSWIKAAQKSSVINFGTEHALFLPVAAKPHENRQYPQSRYAGFCRDSDPDIAATLFRRYRGAYKNCSGFCKRLWSNILPGLWHEKIVTQQRRNME